MSEAIQIVLIVCGTVIFLSILALLFMKSVINKEFHQDNKNQKQTWDGIGRKQPTYPRPPRPGYQPKLRHNNNGELEKMRKPPSTGSRIK